MKKRFLLAIISTVLVLSACAGIGSKKGPSILLEDTLAHEEIFGEAQSVEMNIKKTADPSSVKKPKIGVQYKRSLDGKSIDIRYVAAISSLDVQAKWYRSVAMQDSNAPKKFSDQAFPSTVAYSEINNDGSVTKASSLGDGYIRFVVYTLRNIPINPDDGTDYQYAYLAAYLDLCDSETGTSIISSDVVAVNMNQVHCFSFGKDAFDGYFIEGKIGGVSDQFKAINDGEKPTGYNAVERDLVFSANDDFGLFKYTSAQFQFFGRYDFSRGIDTFSLEDSSAISTNYSKVKVAGTYSLYVKEDNEYYLTMHKDLYLVPGTWNQGAGEKYVIYAWHEDGGSVISPKWLDMTKNSDDLWSYSNFDVGFYSKFILLRFDHNVLPKDYKFNSDEYTNDHTYWNKTVNIDYFWYYSDGWKQITSINDSQFGYNEFEINGWNEDNYVRRAHSA